MAIRLPRLRWAIIGPALLTGLLLGIGIAVGASAPSTGLLRIGMMTFFILSFLLIGASLTYRLLVDGFDHPAGD